MITLEDWMKTRGMRGKPAEYARFLWMLDCRGLSITLLAGMISGRTEGDAKGSAPRGRPGLNCVLLGQRSGKGTWPKLEKVLHADEFKCIKAFADAEWERNRTAAKGVPSSVARLREENAALKQEVDALRRQVEIAGRAPCALLLSLIGLTDRESSQGDWRVTLDYDNSGDVARVLDGDGKVIGECGELDMDPDRQFVSAIEKAVEQNTTPA